MGPGAVPAEVVDGVHDRGVEVERGQASVEVGVVAPLGEHRRQAGGTTHGHVPVVGFVRDLLEVQVAGQHGGRRLRPPPGQPGDAIGGVAHQRQVVGNRLGSNAETVDDAVPVVAHALAPVELHDAEPVVDDLGEVLVGGADEDAVHPGVLSGLHRRCAHGVVGLVLDHGEDPEARRREHRLEQRELGEEFRRHALAGLVALEHLVAEGLDHLVGGDADVGGALLEHSEDRADDRPRGRHLAAVGRHVRWHREVVAEQLVRSVDEVNLHAAPPAFRTFSDLSPRASAVPRPVR